MAEYTPTDEEVRDSYVSGRIEDDSEGGRWADGRGAEADFAAWLAAHDARVKAEAQVAILRQTATDCESHRDYLRLWRLAKLIEREVSR